MEFINLLSGRKFHSPLDLTKVRLQASGDSGMIASLRKTIRTAGEPYVVSIHHHIPVPSILAFFTYLDSATLSFTYIYHVSLIR